MTSVRDCVDLVSREYGFAPVRLRGDERTAELVRARMIAYWLSRETTALSLTNIGKYIGLRDHTTITYGVKKVEKLRKDSPAFRAETDTLLAKLNANAPVTEGGRHGNGLTEYPKAWL